MSVASIGIHGHAEQLPGHLGKLENLVERIRRDQEDNTGLSLFVHLNLEKRSGKGSHIS